MATTLDTYRLLGRSGLRVSPLALGTMTFGVTTGWGSTDAEAAAITNRYIERGGNFIDTANMYGELGGSERVLAPLLKDRRERIVLATKYTMTMDPTDPNAGGNHRKNMVQAVEASLRRLGTDYIDLYYLHIWDERTPVDEILRAFDDLVRSGKIVYGALSDLPAWQASRMQAMADLRGWSPFVALQVPYSLAQRTVEAELLPMAQAMGMGVLPWAALSSGMLTGRYSRADLEARDAGQAVQSDDGPSRRAAATAGLTETILDIADVVREVAGELERSPAQVALAWTLLHPAVCSPLIGARTPEQLEDSLGSLEIDFTDDQRARLDAVSAVEHPFPHKLLGSPFAKAMMGTHQTLPRQS